MIDTTVLLSFFMPFVVCANSLFQKEAFYRPTHSPSTFLLCYSWQTSRPATVIAAFTSNGRWLGICKGDGAHYSSGIS